MGMSHLKIILCRSKPPKLKDSVLNSRDETWTQTVT